jgi:hypothetical protein
MSGAAPVDQKLRPLSDHALRVMDCIARSDGGVPAYRINPGVRGRLYRENLVRASSVFSTTRLVLTDDGRKVLELNKERLK